MTSLVVKIEKVKLNERRILYSKDGSYEIVVHFNEYGMYEAEDNLFNCPFSDLNRLIDSINYDLKWYWLNLEMLENKSVKSKMLKYFHELKE